MPITGESCDKPPRIAFAIDSSQSILLQDFRDQQSLIGSVVTNFQSGASAGDFAVVLYNTRVHVNITFGQFDSFYNLQNAINTLPFMHSNKKGSDLDNLFNATFVKIPEVFLLVKEELNEKYAVGLRVADGKLKGVKKIAVTFGVQSNIRDISDFHAVFQYADTSKFSEFSVITKITDTICHGKSLHSCNTSKNKFQSQLVRCFFFVVNVKYNWSRQWFVIARLHMLPTESPL